MKFSHKILLAASLVVILAFAAFAGYSIHAQREAISRSLTATLGETGRVAAANIAYWLDARVKLLESEADALARDSSPAVLAGLLSQKTYVGNFKSTYLGEVDGTYTARPVSPLPADYDPRKRPWYDAAVKQQGTILTAPYVFASTGQLGITIATPLSRDGQLLGVVGADLNLKTLVDIITSLDAGGLGEAFLVDGDGKILVSLNPDKVLKNLKDVYPDQTPLLGASLSETHEAGQARLLGFTPVSGLPSVTWFLGLSVDRKKAYAAATEARDSAIVVTIVAVLAIVALLGVLIRALLGPLRSLTQAMTDIAEGEGDLTRRLTHRGRDEFGALAEAFNRFVERIHGSIREVAQSTGQLNLASRQVLDASSASMRQSDVQAERTGSVADAIDQLGTTTQGIAHSAAQASVEAASAREQAEAGRDVLDQALASMQDLSQKIGSSCEHIQALDGKASNIGQILDVIRGISDQTNLLALNAAIEAARAGEAGRGFAVVADEVRTLAHRTQSSAQQIHKMIEELQSSSRSAVDIMTISQAQSTHSMQVAQQAGALLGVVTTRVGEQNQSIANATVQQTAAVETLNVDIHQIDLLNQQSVQRLETTLQACTALEAEAVRLQRLVGGFRI